MPQVPPPARLYPQGTPHQLTAQVGTWESPCSSQMSPCGLMSPKPAEGQLLLPGTLRREPVSGPVCFLDTLKLPSSRTVPQRHATLCLPALCLRPESQKSLSPRSSSWYPPPSNCLGLVPLQTARSICRPSIIVTAPTSPNQTVPTFLSFKWQLRAWLGSTETRGGQHLSQPGCLLAHMPQAQTA